MTIEAWLAAAIADVERRGLPELRPLLETLAKSTATLRRVEQASRPSVPPAAGERS